MIYCMAAIELVDHLLSQNNKETEYNQALVHKNSGTPWTVDFPKLQTLDLLYPESWLHHQIWSKVHWKIDDIKWISYTFNTQRCTVNLYFLLVSQKIHPSIYLVSQSLHGCNGITFLQQSTGKMQGTTWRCHQSSFAKRLNTQNKTNFITSINLTDVNHVKWNFTVKWFIEELHIQRKQWAKHRSLSTNCPF